MPPVIFVFFPRFGKVGMLHLVQYFLQNIASNVTKEVCLLCHACPMEQSLSSDLYGSNSVDFLEDCEDLVFPSEAGAGTLRQPYMGVFLWVSKWLLRCLDHFGNNFLTKILKYVSVCVVSC